MYTRFTVLGTRKREKTKRNFNNNNKGIIRREEKVGDYFDFFDFHFVDPSFINVGRC